MIILIDELKTFIAIVEKKSFTKAAKFINISQPSVSLHVLNLEKYFNTRLIERSNKQKNIFITRTGKILYKRAKQLLLILDETKNELNDYSNSPSGTLKIGASMTIGEFILPSLLGEFTKNFPNIKFEIVIENTKNIYDKFRNRIIDIALIEGTLPKQDYILKNFYEDTMVIVVPNSFKYEKNSSLKKFLSNQTWIHREDGSGTGENLNIFLNHNSICPKNIIIFGSNYAIKEAVKNNLGITFISSLVIEPDIKNNELKIIPTRTKYKRYFSYLVHNESMSKIIELFLEKLQEYSNINQ